jgi:hypothetical protein
MLLNFKFSVAYSSCYCPSQVTDPSHVHVEANNRLNSGSASSICYQFRVVYLPCCNEICQNKLHKIIFTCSFVWVFDLVSFNLRGRQIEIIRDRSAEKNI